MNNAFLSSSCTLLPFPHGHGNRILLHPALSWKSLRSPSVQLPEPLDSPRTVRFLRGSTALWDAVVETLRLRPGQEVLIPSYHCGLERDTLQKAGLRVRFYAVGRDLRPDWENLRRATGPDTAAVLVIHYFGFAQPLDDIQKLCRQRGWALIEDAAQALFARHHGRAVGTMGDVAVLSLSKLLPLPCGGALRVNRTDLPLPQPRQPALFGFVVRQMLRLLGRPVLASASMRWRVFRQIAHGLQRLLNQLPDRLNAVGTTFQPEWKNVGMDPCSRWLLHRMPLEDICRRRRAHFATLLAASTACRRVRPLIPHLDDEACPLVFPLIVPEGAAPFLDFCHARGVEAEKFWFQPQPDFPVQEFPDAAWLKEHLVALPVHPDLSADDLARLCSLITAWEV
jgi:dTDP-4-amino-4,6-dideoxygalactose transaminase